MESVGFEHNFVRQHFPMAVRLWQGKEPFFVVTEN